VEAANDNHDMNKHRKITFIAGNGRLSDYSPSTFAQARNKGFFVSEIHD